MGPEKVSWREGSGPKMGKRHLGRGITPSKGPWHGGSSGSQGHVEWQERLFGGQTWRAQGGRLRLGDMSTGFEPEADRNTAELVEAAFQQVAWSFLGSRLSINYK